MIPNINGKMQKIIQTTNQLTVQFHRYLKKNDP